MLQITLDFCSFFARQEMNKKTNKVVMFIVASVIGGWPAIHLFHI